MARLEIVINPKTFEIQAEVHGMAGSGCTAITQRFAESGQLLEEQLTEDYYTPQEELVVAD